MNQASNARAKLGIARGRRLQLPVEELRQDAQDVAVPVIALAREQPVGDQPQRDSDPSPA